VFANGFSNTRFVPGYASASFVANVDDLLQGFGAGRVRDYSELTKSR